MADTGIDAFQILDVDKLSLVLGMLVESRVAEFSCEAFSVSFAHEDDEPSEPVKGFVGDAPASSPESYARVFRGNPPKFRPAKD